MKKSFIKQMFIILAIASVVFSCVPARQFEDVKALKDKYQEERDELKKENERLTSSNNELQAQFDKLKGDNNALATDTLIKGNAYRTLTVQYDKINDLYSQLLANQEKLRQGADADAQKAMALLQQTREELQRKEDDLRNLEARLNQERGSLEALRIQNELKEKELAEQNAKVQDLQARLDAQDSVMNALRKKVSDALVGFEGDGLTVTQRDGKVYVSLDEKLLFKSGKWDVDTKGVQALKNLAAVLENNQDINIMIEGHTDELAYSGSGNIQDNWDLSAKRATSIVKILLDNSNIDPKRLTAAGRGPYLPVDTAKTTEARAKNRRTEIILTPNLDELYKIMNAK
ncbi:MAG: OmpA family protein [Bacteroidales bacterium]|nr:OmpA family protein [Bacteroidales bacterium]MCK9498225.1 OmpA family protein [Bacteroidales bacterium]MDY0314247.1 OmpA family protein [Bacteroidales bacterium]